MLRKASQISLLAALSFGECPRVLMILRRRALTRSIALAAADASRSCQRA
jgi:hypothetical protein